LPSKAASHLAAFFVVRIYI